MKLFLGLMVLSFFSATVLADAKACFRIVDRYQSVKKVVGSVCVESEANSFPNSEIGISVFMGGVLEHRFVGKASAVSPASHHCGGKEHDCWTIPAGFQIFGEDGDYRLYLNLSPYLYINSCVRCSGSGISVPGKRNLELE